MPTQNQHAQTSIEPLLLLSRHKSHVYISNLSPSRPPDHRRALLRRRLWTEHALAFIEHADLPLAWTLLVVELEVPQVLQVYGVLLLHLAIRIFKCHDTISVKHDLCFFTCTVYSIQLTNESLWQYFECFLLCLWLLLRLLYLLLLLLLFGWLFPIENSEHDWISQFFILRHLR